MPDEVIENEEIVLHKYGWKRDLPDRRDLKYEMPTSLDATTLPKSIDLRPMMPPVYNQETLGSCTAQALGADVHFQLIKQGVTDHWMPSRLFIYYNERMIEGTINIDSGAELRDGIKSLHNWGVCPENLHPHDIAAFKKKPTRVAYKEAAKHCISGYFRINQNLEHMKSVLANNDPFVFGFTVYESFESKEVAKTGVMPMPSKSERAFGGHAVLACGYDDEKNVIIVRNSWGEGWGDKGYFYMPYAFVVDPDCCADFWTITQIPA